MVTALEMQNSLLSSISQKGIMISTSWQLKSHWVSERCRRSDRQVVKVETSIRIMIGNSSTARQVGSYYQLELYYASRNTV